MGRVKPGTAQKDSPRVAAAPRAPGLEEEQDEEEEEVEEQGPDPRRLWACSAVAAA